MKFMARMIVAATALFLLSLLCFCWLIHPDDKRISFVDQSDPQGRSIEATLVPVKERYKRAVTLLQTPLEHHLDCDNAAYGAALADFIRAFPDYAIVKSHRFTSPYQVYAPVGDYPVRLEAMDGVFIPRGATLSVSPRLHGRHSLRFFAIATQEGPARLEVKQGGQDVLAATLPTLKGPTEGSKGFWQKNVLRYWRVDLAQTVSRWASQRIDLDLKSETETLTLQCIASTGPGCIVSDLTFYAPTKEPVKSAIVILVDTLRGDGLQSKAAPNMQALAATGTQFSQAMAAGNMTSPSTNAFLSCRRPSDLGGVAFAYSATSALRESFYAAQPPSFPALFRRAGYDTAMIGNVSVISEIYGVGVQHGFDRQIALERDAYDTPDITREALEWLRANADHPFLLYLHYNGPHAPYRAPLADIRRTWPGVSVFKAYPDLLRWLYQSEISYTDRYLGKVFAALDALGIRDDVEIVLTADHGDQHTVRHFTPNAAGPSFEGAYFDHGATLLNDEIHVPLVVREAGQRQHRDIQNYVTALDVGPTLLESFAIPMQTNCAGRSLVKAVKSGLMSDDLVQRAFGSEGFQGRAIFFDGRYKFIRLYEPTDKLIFDGHYYGGERRLYYKDRQLYDLAEDPNETKDLVSVDAQLLGRAESLYDAFYGVKDAYELVVDDPGERPFDVDLPVGTVARSEYDDVRVETLAGGAVHVSGRDRRRSTIRMAPAPSGIPAVRIDGVAVPVTMTSMRLPLTMMPTELPREQGGRYTLLEPGTKSEAFLRRVEDNGQDNRRIVTGNPRFEKVLREWGYLNDK